MTRRATWSHNSDFGTNVFVVPSRLQAVTVATVPTVVLLVRHDLHLQLPHLVNYIIANGQQLAPLPSSKEESPLSDYVQHVYLPAWVRGDPWMEAIPGLTTREANGSPQVPCRSSSATQRRMRMEECGRCACVERHSRLRLVGLSSAGYCVADARARHRVHRLHDDKGPLLQRGHGQVPVVRHWLQVGAVARPHGVPHLQDSQVKGSHLQEVGFERVRTVQAGLVLPAAIQVDAVPQEVNRRRFFFFFALQTKESTCFLTVHFTDARPLLGMSSPSHNPSLDQRASLFAQTDEPASQELSG